MKPKIFLFCIPTHSGSGIVRGSTRGGDVLGHAMAEDGEVLSQHLSSNEDFSKHDMGLTSDWKHDDYKKKYPDGFELEWVNWSEDAETNEAFAKAKALNKALGDSDQKMEEGSEAKSS